MTPRQEQIRAIAADIVEECGPYARMAALFLAGERREEGDDDGTILWMRVADVVAELSAERVPPRRLH
jgi:hypothetical protein